MTTKDLAYNGVIAAIYVALTLVSIPISYGPIQFRIAEMLILLVFFKKNYTIGICLGTALANFGSTLSLWDVVFGTLATLIACVGIMLSKHLLTAALYPVIANAVIIGLEIYVLGGCGPFLTYLVPSLQVLAGEAAVIACGYILFMLLRKRKDFGDIINGDRNLDFKW